MKITDALEGVLRLLVSTDQEKAEPEAARPLPDWVKRANDARAAGEPKMTPSAEAEPSLAEAESESLDREDAEREERSIPGLLDSLITWVQAQDNDEADSPAARAEPAPATEPVPAPEPAPPVAVPAPRDRDFGHLEAAANLAE